MNHPVEVRNWFFIDLDSHENFLSWMGQLTGEFLQKVKVHRTGRRSYRYIEDAKELHIINVGCVPQLKGMLYVNKGCQLKNVPFCLCFYHL